MAQRPEPIANSIKKRCKKAHVFVKQTLKENIRLYIWMNQMALEFDKKWQCLALNGIKIYLNGITNPSYILFGH